MEKRSLVHIEIPMIDKDQTADFYRDLCGWEFTHDKDYDYTSFSTGNVGGGLSPVTEFNPVGNVLVYLHSDDLEADVKRVEELGGKIIAPRMDVGDMGAFAVFTDPVGNTMAFWQTL